MLRPEGRKFWERVKKSEKGLLRNELESWSQKLRVRVSNRSTTNTPRKLCKQILGHHTEKIKKLGESFKFPPSKLRVKLLASIAVPLPFNFLI